MTPLEGVATPQEGVVTPLEGVATPQEGVVTPLQIIAHVRLSLNR